MCHRGTADRESLRTCMRVIENDAQLTDLLPVARREAKAGFGNDEVYLEKLVR